MQLLSRIFIFTLIASLGFCLPTAQAGKRDKTPDHYTNSHTNPDPDFAPGPYPAPDTKAALEHYDTMVDALDPDGDLILDVQKEEGNEISWKAIKNKTASVLGYFRTYDGYISFNNGKFSKAELLISVNSVDSAVPGRDDRIRTIFFKSMQSEMSTAILVLDRILDGPPYLSAIQNGATHEIIVDGFFTLGTETLPVRVQLQVMWNNDKEVLIIKTLKPLQLLVSDLSLEKGLPELMKECNHKSVGNLVEIGCQLSFE